MSKRRPSPAMIIAMIALVLGLGGAAIAADLTKPQVKKIAKKVANKQIKKKALLKGQESSLNVASATNAGNVDGQSVLKVYATVADGANDVTVATFGPYTMTASCADDVEDLEVTTSTQDVAMVAESTGNITSEFDEDEGGAAPNEVNIDGTNDRGMGSFSVTQSNGTTYTGQIGFDDPNVFGGVDTCVVFGKVIHDG